MDKETKERVLERSKIITRTWKRKIIRKKMSCAGHIVRGNARDQPLIIMEVRIEETRESDDREEAG